MSWTTDTGSEIETDGDDVTVTFEMQLPAPPADEQED